MFLRGGAGGIGLPCQDGLEDGVVLGFFGLEPAESKLPEVEGTAMHQGYALQWWVFAGAAVAFSIVVARGFTPRIDKK